MEFKYYTVICFESEQAATAFSQSYHNHLWQGGTKYSFPVSETDEQTACVIIYNLNDLLETDIVKVSIAKVSTDFIPLT